MNKKNLIVWSALSASIALIAVLSLFAQAVRTPDSNPQPVIPLEDPAAKSNPAEYVPATSAPAPAGSAAESNALQAAATLNTAPATPVNSGATPTPAPAPAPAAETTPTPSVMHQEPIASLTVEEAAPTPDVEPEDQTLNIALPTNQQPNLISIALDEVPLLDVVRMFTRISGANIIASASNLHGTVTVNIQDVEWKPALDSILSMHNMALMETTAGSKIYTIATRPAGQPDPLVADTIFLSYAPVTNVITIVSSMLAGQGSVVPFNSGNALIVRATSANILEIKRVIKEIDQPRKQVYIEAKFIELTDKAIKDLGINWQVLEGYKVGVSGMKIGYDNKGEKVNSSKDTQNQKDNRIHIDGINERYDKDGQQYQEVTPGTPAVIQNGVVITPATPDLITPTRTLTDTIDQSKLNEQSLLASDARTITDIRTALLSADDFSVILSALKQTTGITVASNPKIIVANDETATIHIGDNEPNIKGTVTPGQQGQANTTTYELDDKEPYFKFGVTLDVTPTINSESNITVRIAPTISRFVQNKVAPDGNSFPITSTKTIKTIFSLDNGKTAAIGGLTETEDRDVTKKIPLLGDIPLIGKYLFSHTHKEKSQTETIIFVTVGIASPGSMDNRIGLPENSDLVERQLVLSENQRELNQQELQKFKDEIAQKKKAAAEKKAKNAK
jgi:type II secretory pathway component GspD/PulD (secretin)